MFSKYKFALLLGLSFLLFACDDDGDEDDPTPTSNISLSISDVNVAINENPANGQIVAKPSWTGNPPSITPTFTLSQSLQGGLDLLDPTSTEMTVSDSSFFDYEIRTSVSGQIFGFVNGNQFSANVNITINDLLEVGSVQVRLNNGESPFDIIDSDVTLLDSLYTKAYQGGYIFYLDTASETGLLVAPTNAGTISYAWDSTSVQSNIVQTNATGTAIGDGGSNSTQIIQTIGSAAEAANAADSYSAGGYSDWYLPSRDELLEIRSLFFIPQVGPAGFSSFTEGSGLWSSSEFDTQGAIYVSFNRSNPTTFASTFKIIDLDVRPVRSF